MIGALAATAACNTSATAPGIAAATAPTGATAVAAATPLEPATFTDPGIELAPGEGREIMLSKCLGCHDLGGIDLFAGFYSREDWRKLIETMIAHGAPLDAEEAGAVVDYLALHYSPKP